MRQSFASLFVGTASPTGRGCTNQYFEIKEALETLFGRPVDLVIPSAIENPYFRESVDETRTLLYAA